VTLAELNTLDRQAFVDTIGWVFEHSPWVADRTWTRRPFASLDALHTALVAILQAATRDEQLALLRAHPDLGTRATMSAASTGEQSGAGLTSLTPEMFATLQRLNDEYKSRFGFPFLYAVKGSTAAEIIAALERRTGNGRDDEFMEALAQVSRIARFRLESTLRVDA